MVRDEGRGLQVLFSPLLSCSSMSILASSRCWLWPTCWRPSAWASGTAAASSRRSWPWPRSCASCPWRFQRRRKARRRAPCEPERWHRDAMAGSWLPRSALSSSPRAWHPVALLVLGAALPRLEPLGHVFCSVRTGLRPFPVPTCGARAGFPWCHRRSVDGDPIMAQSRATRGCFFIQCL